MANIKRLERLVAVLEDVKTDPKKNREFDMSAWGEEVSKCGTHLCACGWAASDPVLGGQGLKLRRAKRSDFDDGPLVFDWKKQFILRFGRIEHFEAAAKFFGITRWSAEQLFDPTEYHDARDINAVIERVRDFISELPVSAP